MFGLFVILFTVIPALEIYLLFSIGAQIGGLNTLLVVIITGILGAALAKSQGLSILMKIQNEMGKGEIPGNQIIQGLMVFAGGLLLLTPGFMTDIFGFSLVLPGTRHILMLWVRKMIERNIARGNVHFHIFKNGQHFSSAQRADDYEQSIVEGDIVEAEYTEKSESLDKGQ